jgi:hypothetical protein
MGKKSIAEYNRTFQNVTDIIGKAVASLSPVNPYVRSSPPSGGGGGGGTAIPSSTVGLEPLKQLIAIWESCGGDMSKYNTESCYNAWSSTTGWKAGHGGKDIRNTTIADIIATGNGKAVGKYQVMSGVGNTLESACSSLGINKSTTKFNEATQERIGEWLILEKITGVKSYINGGSSNQGDQNQLKKAIQALAFEWAALPISTTRILSGVKIPNNENNVVTGIGKRACYGGTSTNPAYGHIDIGESAKALIQSRINSGGGTPSFVPTYFNALASPPPQPPSLSPTPPPSSPPPFVPLTPP